MRKNIIPKENFGTVPDVNRDETGETCQPAGWYPYCLPPLDSWFQEIFYLKAERKLITAQAVKARYLGEDDDNRSIMDIIDYHNGDMEGKLKWGTQKNYFTTQRYISKFLQKSYKATDKYLQELDYNFIIKFKKYLRNDIPEDHQKPMGNNTVIKHIELFRKLINLSHKLGWIERDPCINFKSKFTKKERGFLSLDELQEIENKRLAIVRLHLKYIKIVI